MPRHALEAVSEAKLSKLQRRILVLALENKRLEQRDFDAPSGADVFYAEILARVFGFPAKKNPRLAPRNRIFKPAEIGRRRYRCAMATLSRSVLHLHIRALVTSAHSKHSTWAGANLTPRGAQVARALAQTVNPELS
jgi:hypothetical protein